MIYEFYEQNLGDLVYEQSPHPEEVIKKVLRKILESLSHMHGYF